MMLPLVGIYLTVLMLVLVRSLSYTPCASFREETYTPDTVLLRSFSCTPRAGFSEEFLLHF